MTRTVRFVLGAFAAALCVACGGSSAMAPLTVSLSVSGRLERGSAVTIALHQGADSTMVTSASELAVVPAASAQPQSDGSLLLLQSGALAITATLPDGRHANASITVATPPSIVFDGVVAGNQDIYRVALDGGDLQRLTTDPGADSHPTAAAGTVVFTSYRTGNAELFSVNASGGNETRLTTSADNKTEPALSNDGSRLAFVSDAGGVGRIMSATASAGGAVRFTPVAFGFGGSGEGTPRWSPAGDRIAFVSTASGSAGVYLAAQGLAPTAALVDSHANVEPAWSPDGTEVVVTSNRDGDTGLFVLTLSTSALSRVSFKPANEGQATWLADGRIVYVAFVGSGSVLRWLDPASPSAVRDIPLTIGSPLHPSAIR